MIDENTTAILDQLKEIQKTLNSCAIALGLVAAATLLPLLKSWFS